MYHLLGILYSSLEMQVNSQIILYNKIKFLVQFIKKFKFKNRQYITKA